jgi:hypothetical protein
MTRLFTALLVILTFALSACERHPLPGQTQVTHTHGSNGAHEEHHDAATPPATTHAAEKAAAAHAPTGAAHEEKPTFFPEKK